MIQFKYKVLGGHTHLEVRSGPANTSGHLALAGRLILDNDDAESLLYALRNGRTSATYILLVEDKEPLA